MTYRFRPATNADRATVESLVFGILAEHGLSPDPDGTDADLRDLKAAYIDSGGLFDVLVDETGFVVGTVGLFPVSASTCELRKMYLLSSARGGGLGRRLLEHALARATELGFTRIVLETAAVLRAAVSLYEGYGFRPYTPEHLVSRCDSAYYLELPATNASSPCPTA